MLNENKLATIETKLASLSESMDNVKEPSENDERVDRLFEMMNQWNSTSQQVPTIVERLVSLKSIHEQSASAVNTIQQLQKDQDVITNLLNSSLSSMNQVCI